MRKWGRLFIGLIGLLWAGLIFYPGSALAHAGLIRAEPADLCSSLEPIPLPSDSPACASGLILTTPPDFVRLWFSEPVQPTRRSLIIIAPSGQRVEQGSASVNGLELRIALNPIVKEEGTYQITWQALSGDTHPVRGSFAFSVGRASATVALKTEVGAVSPLGLGLQIVARWLHFCGLALGFGPFAFQWLMLNSPDSPSVERRLERLVRTGIVLMLLAASLALLGQTASLGIEQLFDPDAFGDVLASSFGRVLGQRLGAVGLLWVLLGLGHSSRVSLLALALGLALTLVDGQASHAVSVEPLGLALLLNTVHLSAMAVWLGGLATLISVWNLAQLKERRATLVGRFAPIAGGCVGLMLVSGAGLSWLLVKQPAALLNSNYGLTLLFKLSLLIPVLLLAWQGRRLKEFSLRWWTFEGLALLGVLVLAGLLVSLPPPL